MFHRLARVVATLAFLIASGTAFPASIMYDLTNVNENRWKYQYAIENVPFVRPIQEFSIYFDLGPNRSVLHSDISITGLPADWVGLLADPDPNLPHAGFFDALTIGVGIGAGLLLEGFAVEFDWLGAGLPPAQRYEILDPDTFDVLDSGFTSVRDLPPPVSVPEPPMPLLLLAAALGGLLLIRSRRTRCGPERRP